MGDLLTLTDDTVTVAGSVVATSVDVNGNGDVSGTLTMSGNAAAITHSGSTSLSISSGQFVDVESIRFTDAAIGISSDADLITLTDNTVTVAGSVVATGVDLNGDADVSGTLTLSGDDAAITHSGGTSLTISSGHYVDVESIRFTAAAIGISSDANLITLTDNTVTVAGSVVATGV